MEEWKTIHQEINISPEVLKEFGSVVDFLHLNEEKISLRLTINLDPSLKNYNGFAVTLKP